MIGGAVPVPEFEAAELGVQERARFAFGAGGAGDALLTALAVPAAPPLTVPTDATGLHGSRCLVVGGHDANVTPRRRCLPAGDRGVEVGAADADQPAGESDGPQVAASDPPLDGADTDAEQVGDSGDGQVLARHAPVIGAVDRP